MAGVLLRHSRPSCLKDLLRLTSIATQFDLIFLETNPSGIHSLACSSNLTAFHSCFTTTATACLSPSSHKHYDVPSPPHRLPWHVHRRTYKCTQPTTTTGGWTFSQVVNLPNSLSMFRLLSGPVIAMWILNGQYHIAVPVLIFSASTDWMDGYFARKAEILNGKSNVLGSYLDPLADKVLIGSVVGALGYTGALPGPLVGVVVGRDVALLLGAFAMRAHALHWKWPGAKQFFRIAPSSYDDDDETKTLSPRTTPLSHAAPVAPVIKPLMISKVNTGLQIALVGACMTEAWVGWPGVGAVWGLAWATGGTTVASLAAYLRAFVRGDLFTNVQKDKMK